MGVACCRLSSLYVKHTIFLNVFDVFVEARIFALNGFQGIGIRVSRMPEQSEAEHVTLRLRTRQPNSALFESTSAVSTAPDKMALQIIDGSLAVFYNLGITTKVSDC